MILTPPPFAATRDWLHNGVDVEYSVHQGEAESADVSGAFSFPTVAPKWIKDDKDSFA